MHDVISMFFNLLRFVAYHVIYPGECSMCTWKKCVFCCLGWIVHMYLLSPPGLFNVSLKSTLYLLIISLDVLHIHIGGVLNSSTIIVLRSYSAFISINICLYIEVFLAGCVVIFHCYALVGLICLSSSIRLLCLLPQSLFWSLLYLI